MPGKIEAGATIFPSRPLRYGVALASVGLALGLKLLLDPLTVQDTPFLLTFGAIMVSAWYGGLGPGLLATVLAAVITDFFFLYPRGAFSGVSRAEALPLAAFLIEGGLVSFMASSLRSATARAEASAQEARGHVTERRRAEQQLNATLERLLTLYETGRLLGSSLRQEDISSRLLESMKRVCDLSAAVLELQDDRGQWHVLCAMGPENLLSWARSTEAVQAARFAALETQEPQSFELRNSNLNQIHLSGMCLPLRGRQRLVGVLEAYSPRSLAEQETMETLASLVSQAASVLENARLYEELAERERQLHDLVRRMLAAQEEERRRVAYEVHDGLAQVAAAAHQRLQTFAKRHPPDSTQGQERLARSLELIQQTVVEARRVIADLRPTALDDFGLATGLRLYAEELCRGGCQVNYEETLGDERLPVEVETALYRVAQEALTNARKHAQSPLIHLRLERLGHRNVCLEVRDWGRGFKLGEVADGGGPGEKIGLSSMEERITWLGGNLRIRSHPGAGTSVVAEVPLPDDEDSGDHER